MSVILPVHNGEKWVDECLQALLDQTVLQARPDVLIELSAYDDGSTDGTWAKMNEWTPKLEA